MNVSITAPGKPTLIWSMEKLESALRKSHTDDSVDLYLLQLESKGSMKFNAGGVVATVTLIGDETPPLCVVCSTPLPGDCEEGDVCENCPSPSGDE